MPDAAEYFANHARRERFPWSLYHGELNHRIAACLREHARGGHARILIVGCGLDVDVKGAPGNTEFFGCDLDARAIETCKKAFPDKAARFAVCPGPYELPSGGPFSQAFDVILAKEVVEHTLEPERWAKGLSARLMPGGELLLSTPNYGRFSTLPILESTVLELLARRDGYSRKHIHPTRFDKRRLEALDVGPDMELVSVHRTLTGWSMLGRWRRRV